MVRLNRIYTRTGDDGTTGLGNGERRPKFDARVAAYGEVDETNTAIGLARLATSAPGAADLAPVDAMLKRIQNDLFDLGADLCMPAPASVASAKPARAPLRILPRQVEQLEAAIDELNADLSPLRSFVLPGGTPAAAALHQARAVCRRAERQIVALAAIEGEAVGAAALAYVNRLSDFLFVAARFANDRGKGDILWSPGANQSGT
jgi:cob(I)alamin adenosyltransferase